MDTWEFLAGLGLFLYGMSLLEKVLKKLSGRSFKLFLAKYTQRLPYAITGGALITGLVQSSSVVSLLVLALVEAGTIGPVPVLGGTPRASGLRPVRLRADLTDPGA